MTEQRQWTHEELRDLLEKGSVIDLEKLIAKPDRKYRVEAARDYTIAAFRSVAESEVLPDDIRILVQRILALYETASDPFLGMNLSTMEGQQSQQPRGFDAEDLSERVHEDWANEE
jgi:hypothetical protein